DGLFDSSIFMAGSTFEFTFDEAGTYDYFCMVHPWMTGIINVN
ncbi:MAG: plastocyanin/azurin family copper-binding protein, partial [Nitrosopumilus sp.]